jgi:dTDP-4-amino-4,6-dideoxygalactose transaminase
VIYDAAHCFGVNHKGQGICNFGDLSILSFHATKVFNTMEGGAIVCHDEATKRRIDYLKNFGFAGETTIMAPGINSKMNEMQAALGLVQLKHYDENIQKRKAIAEAYKSALQDINGITYLPNPDDTDSNHAYYPIFVDANKYGMSRDELYQKLKQNNIHGRRYFYPLISEFSMYKGLDSSRPDKLPVAHKMAEQVICLPIYPDLEKESVLRIARLIQNKGND